MKKLSLSLICLTILTFSLSLSSCSKKDGPETEATGQATYVLDESSNSNLKVDGKLAEGAVADESVTLAVGINAVSTGNWELSTALVDGIYFYGKGNITGTGVQKISLHAKGTPTRSGTITLKLHGGIPFDVEVLAAP